MGYERTPGGKSGNAASVSYPNSSGTATVAPRPYFIDALDYGVKADNSTDDTAAIQAAIDAASTPALYGLTGNDQVANVVMLPRGRMVISSPGVKMNANVELRGHGPASTYLVYNGSGGTANTDVTPVAVTNCAVRLKTGAEVQCEVRNLGIILNRSSFGTGDDGINFTQTGGASILGDTRHVIENVIIVNGRYQIVLNSGSECRIRNIGCYRANGGTYGVLWIGGTDHFIESLTLAQPSSAANFNAGIRSQTSNTRFVNCKVFGGGGETAIKDSGQRNQYIGCEVQDYNGSGMSIGESTILGGLIDSCAGGLDCAGGTSGSTTVRGLRIVNRPGGAYTLAYAINVPDNDNADIDVRAGGSGGNTSPIAALFKTSSQTGAGNRIRVNGEGAWTVQAAYAATYTPDPLLATVHSLATLTGPLTIANPAPGSTNGTHVGQRLEFIITQDATGGRAVTFGANYVVTNGAVTTTANAVTRIEFEFDGTLWRETSRAGTGSAASLVTAKGDLLAATGASALTRQGVGSDGQVLTADSTQTTGVKWASAATGGSGPSLPLNRYLMAIIDQNSTMNLTKGVEDCFPLALPGSGTLASVAVLLKTLSTDVGTTLRLGVRADNSGIPGAVLAETSFSADTTTGVTGWKELSGLTAPYGSALVWVSILGQGWTASVPQLEGNASAGYPPVSFLAAATGASLTTLGWSGGHGPVAATVSNAAGTIASAGPPTGSTANTPIPVIAIKRGT